MHQTKKGFLIGAMIGLVWCLLAIYIAIPLLENSSTKNPLVGIPLLILAAPRIYMPHVFILFPEDLLSVIRPICGPDGCYEIPSFMIITGIIIFGLIGALIGRMIKKKPEFSGQI